MPLLYFWLVYALVFTCLTVTPVVCQSTPKRPQTLRAMGRKNTSYYLSNLFSNDEYQEEEAVVHKCHITLCGHCGDVMSRFVDREKHQCQENQKRKKSIEKS